MYEAKANDDSINGQNNKKENRFNCKANRMQTVTVHWESRRRRHDAKKQSFNAENVQN